MPAKWAKTMKGSESGAKSLKKTNEHITKTINVVEKNKRKGETEE